MLPTVLDLLGVALPDELDGIAQMIVRRREPACGRWTTRTSPDPRTSQYFECWGSRAMYADGWKAVTNHVNQLTAAERDLIVGSHDFATDEWALFDTRTDPTEQHRSRGARARRSYGRWSTGGSRRPSATGCSHSTTAR